MYGFYLIPLESNLKSELISGLLSNAGIGDKSVFEVIDNIKQAAIDNNTNIISKFTDEMHQIYQMVRTVLLLINIRSDPLTQPYILSLVVPLCNVAEFPL